MIKAGFSSRVINPPKDISMAGYFNRRPNAGIHDDLLVRVAFFGNDTKTPAGIVIFDLLYTYQILLDTIKTEIAKRPSATLLDKIIFGSTHAHSGPDFYDPEPPSTLKDYILNVARLTVDAIEDALSKMEEVTLKISCTNNNPYSFIRRFWMKNGKVVTNPGKLNPNIVKPESNIDDEVAVLSVVSNSSKKVLGYIANISNHTDTVGGDLISADWPGALEKELRLLTKSDAVVVTLVGASGDVNHFDVTTNIDQTSSAEADRIGKGYAKILAEILPNSTVLEDGNVVSKRFNLETKRRIIPQKDIISAKELIAKNATSSTNKEFTSEELANGNQAVLGKFAQMLINFSEQEGGKEISLPFMSLTIGNNFAICSLPGEPFSAIGSAIKNNSPFKFTFIASNAMFACGYIPLKECFNRGGYEVLPVHGGGLETDSADKFIESAKKVLK